MNGNSDISRMSDIVKGTGRLSFNENLVDNNGPTPSGHLPVSPTSPPQNSEPIVSSSTTISYSSVTSTHDTSPSANIHKSPKPETNSTPDRVQPVRFILILLCRYYI